MSTSATMLNLAKRRRICEGFSAETDWRVLVHGVSPGTSICDFIRVFADKLQARLLACRTNPQAYEETIKNPIPMSYHGTSFLVWLDQIDETSGHGHYYTLTATPIRRNN